MRKKQTPRPLYMTWWHMVSRCSDSTRDDYKNYGGRGIAVCDEWKNSYHAFEAWAYSNGHEKGLSIDRINNDGGYYPSNCRWVDRRAQCRNKRNNRTVTAFGETKLLCEWPDDPRCPVNIATLWARLEVLGWSEQDAVEKPLRTGVTIFGECKFMDEWMSDPRCGVRDQSAFFRRVKKGMSKEDALSKPSKIVNYVSRK